MIIREAAHFDPANPEPGVYRHVPDEAYFSAVAVNHSTLRVLERSPAHFAYQFKHGGGKDSDSKRLGSLVHMMLFTPERVQQATIPAPLNPKTGRAYGMDTNAWRDYAASHPGHLIVSDEEMEQARVMVQRVMAHERLSLLINAASETELVLVWQEDGFVAKGKVDMFCPAAATIGDLKSTADASQRAFAGSVVDWGYDTQAAWYLRGAKACGLGDDLTFVFGVVENEPPHAVAGYELNKTFLSIGAQRVAEWVERLAQCFKANQWPGLSTQIETLAAPAWYIARYCDDDAVSRF